MKWWKKATHTRSSYGGRARVWWKESITETEAAKRAEGPISAMWLSEELRSEAWMKVCAAWLCACVEVGGVELLSAVTQTVLVVPPPAWPVISCYGDKYVTSKIYIPLCMHMYVRNASFCPRPVCSKQNISINKDQKNNDNTYFMI